MIVRYIAHARTFPILIGALTGVFASTVLPVLCVNARVWA